jgi:multidrug efflux pump subunit AcrB
MAETESKSRISPSRALGVAGRIAHGFIDSKLTPLLIVAAVLIGVFSILKTPREEEPQIVVPMLDVFIQMPGASAEEVEQRVSVPTEKLLREVPGVEYVYSISHPGVSMLIVRFYVGTKEENAIVQTYNSSMRTSIAFRPASRNQSLRSARLMMYRSWL